MFLFFMFIFMSTFFIDRRWFFKPLSSETSNDMSASMLTFVVSHAICSMLFFSQREESEFWIFGGGTQKRETFLKTPSTKLG